MLGVITQNDSEFTAAIAVDGRRDSIAVKTISILGIVYLPGSFVATFFSMGMFDWNFADATTSSPLKASPALWIYVAITIPLTVMTYIVWMLWSRKESQGGNDRLLLNRARARARNQQQDVRTKEASLVVNGNMV